jgi:hypothetical protein
MRKTIEPERGIPPLKIPSSSTHLSEGNGFYQTKEVDGVWWLVDPDGNAFYIIGTDHASYNVHWCEKLGYVPYHRNCRRRYGGIEAWSDSTVSRLLQWGFNSLAWGHSVALRHRGLAHMEWLNLGSSFAAKEDVCPQTTWTGFPDVFSPGFSAHCEEEAGLRCEPNADDPWLIGYFIDNELEWYGKSLRETGLMEETLRKGPEHPAKARLLQLIQETYPDLAGFNESWNLNLADFDDLLSLQEMPAPNPAIEGDSRRFLRLIAEEYFSTTAGAIRKHDPNHLVLGCRFAGRAPPPAWEKAGEHCDVVSVNCYRKLDLEKGTMVDGFEEDLRRWHGLSRRPLMITEWSFPALDAGLPCNRGGGQRVPTQTDRASAFTIFQTLLFTTPFIVGSDFFMWVDEPRLGISSTFPEDCNYGLVNEQDEPYAELTTAASALNPRVYGLRSMKASSRGT